MTSGVYERKKEMLSGKKNKPKYMDSHKAILEILNEKKSTEEVTKELFDKYRITYCARHVRRHIGEMVKLGWIRKEENLSNLRVPYYLKVRDE